MSDFSAHLERALAAPLPGLRALAGHSPELSFGRHLGPPPHHARDAAVIALFYPAEEPHLALTLRPLSLAHGGQVCLPGGASEPDESANQTALRELHEELGVELPETCIIGHLSPVFVFASNFLVQPVVAYQNQRPTFTPYPAEVEKLIEFPLTQLLDPQIETMLIQRGPLAFTAPCFRFQSERIWGATTLILAELAAVLRNTS